MTTIVERQCPLLLFQLDSESFSPKFEDLSSKLEKGDDEAKMVAIKEIIHCIISGLDMSRLTMQVIKFCLRTKSCEIKKLLQLYWEVLDKTDSVTGKLKPEMILVCNHLLQDLKNANEYIRGSTCRLLCRINECEILEQLIPQLICNLEHRHSYVRKNAVLAMMSIYQKHSELIPDAPTKVFDFLMNEGNMLAKRNGFLMLTNCDLRNALDFFLSIQDKISSLPESMQITVLELTRKVCRSLPVPKSIFVKCAANLLDANSNAVVYEAANTLLSLTPLDSAINRALEAYVRLLQSESDQNVKLIVIHRLNHLKSKYLRNLRHVLMDILRALNTPNIDVKKEILSLVLDLGTNNNIEDIITCLKKEIILTNENNMANAAAKHATHGLISAIDVNNINSGGISGTNSSVSGTSGSGGGGGSGSGTSGGGGTSGALGTSGTSGTSGSNNISGAGSSGVGGGGTSSSGSGVGSGNDSVYNNAMNIEYNNLLVETIHECAVKFPKVASSVVHLLINYLGEDDVSMGMGIGSNLKNKQSSSFYGGYYGSFNAMSSHSGVSRSTAYDVILFVREIVQEYGDLRESILIKLIESFNSIKSQQVYRVALWILGEYCDNFELIESIFNKELIVPLSNNSLLDLNNEDGFGNESNLQSMTNDKTSKDDNLSNEKYTTRTVVLDDGTYAQETIIKENISDTPTNSMITKDKKRKKGKNKENERDNERDSEIGNKKFNYFSETILNNLIKSGEYYLSTVLASTILKLVMRLRVLVENENDKIKKLYKIRVLNRITAHCLLTIVSIIKFGDSIAKAKASINANVKLNEKERGKDNESENESESVNNLNIVSTDNSNVKKRKELDNDSRDRLNFVIDCLMNNKINNNLNYQLCKDVYLNKCQESFGLLLSRKRDENDTTITNNNNNNIINNINSDGKIINDKNINNNNINNNNKQSFDGKKVTQFDKMISFRALAGLEFSEFDEDDIVNIKKAVGSSIDSKDDTFASRLARVHQLTGFSDAVYAEACVTVHQFDIILDILIINNTIDTLQNVSLELHTSGDLKLVDKPSKFTLAKKSSKRIEASIKVSSTENGVIFGCIVFDTTKATIDENIVVMNCIHMDIMDYVHPSPCTIDKFRDMWVEFEWENKVPVNTDINDLNLYLKHVANITNMQLLTEMSNNQTNNCQFLAANLHAKSIFGEHALMNVSIELKNEEKVTGHIRIRCKSQGIALSLGEKITNKQRKLEN